MISTCPGCNKTYETELDAPPRSQRTQSIQTMFPDAEPYQWEQCILGYCSDECWDKDMGITGYIYQKGKRFILTVTGSRRKLKP